MALKSRYKRRIFLIITFFFGLSILALIFVPPMFTLNGLKPKIEQTILDQTGITAKIKGNINFSLLGHATIVAHDIETPIGEIGSLLFTIPLTSIFDLNNAPLTGNISVYKANVKITSLIPEKFDHQIKIYDSDVSFKNRNFEIIRATLKDGILSGIIRTQNHKYDIEFEHDLFYVRNQNDKIEITGQIYADGSVRGQISMKTEDINKWFGFEYPEIKEQITLTTNFEWDGNRSFAFKDIKANKFSGNIYIFSDGSKKIELNGKDITYDFSFLFQPSNILYKTNFNLEFYGNLKFGLYNFNHLKINAVGTKEALQISDIIADDIAITGGYIDEYGAHNILINMPYEGLPSKCLFSGTPDNWKCSEFTYGNYSGSFSISGDKFEIFIQSDTPMPDRETLIRWAKKLGNTGRINFQFSDIAGSFEITPQQNMLPSYTFAQDKTLQWLNPNIKNIPDFMRNVRGDFMWQGDSMFFVPESGRWTLELTKTFFKIHGKNFKEWFPNIDLQALNNLNYVVSGTYSGNNVSNLKLEIAGQEFSGSVSGNNITLHTKILNIDSFLNQSFLDSYEELEFLVNSPITIPFEIPINLSLSADSFIYNGNEFKNFVYSLKSGIQTFSITDNARGNLLATLKKEKNIYKIFAQLNKFVINGSLLSSYMPLNVKDTMITAEINMQTFGNIAHDLSYNISGDLDMSFEGGYLIGIGIDNFYSYAENMTTLNAELALANALESGNSVIKKMRIIGNYKNGKFQTTQPITLQLHHTDGTGKLEIVDNNMWAKFNLTLRGTSPEPTQIELSIYPDNKRSYSLSEIITTLDPSFMKAFIKTHEKF